MGAGPPSGRAGPPRSQSGGTAQRITELAGYEILEKIGQGGMGAVYKARQKSLDRIVALKVLPPRLAQDPQFIERFLREARASAKLNHLNIIQGIDVGQEKGLYYFAMEFVEGQSLQRMLKQRGSLPEPLALQIMRQIAAALDCAHQAGLIHRDIKPDNILYTPDGTAKLADLGLAKQIGEDSSLTQTGASVGTPYYISPEQARGEKGLDGRSDLYSLGATWFHLLTGQVPFPGETSAVIMVKHLNDPVPKAHRINPEISEGLSRLIERLMRKNRDQRIASAKELLTQIDALLAGKGFRDTGPQGAVETSRVKPLGPGARAQAALERKEAAQGPRPSTAWIPLLAGAVLLAGAAAFFFAGREEAPLARPTPGRAPQNPPPGSPAAPPLPAPASAPSVAPTPARNRELQEAWEEARRWEEAHAEEYPEILRRYGELKDQAATQPGRNPFKDELSAAVARVEKRRADAAEKLWLELEAKVKTSTDSGDYDEALKLLAALPGTLAPLLSERAQERGEALKKTAEERLQAALKEAEEASKSGAPAKGLTVLNGVQAVAYTPLRQPLQALKARLEAEQANEGDLARKRETAAAEQVLHAQLARFDELVLERRDWAEARRLAEENAKKGSEAFKPQWTAMLEVTQAREQRQELEKANLRGWAGKEVEFELQGKRMAGKVEGIAGAELEIKTREGAVFRTQLSGLTEAQQQRIRGDWQPQTVAQKTALALELIAKSGGAREVPRNASEKEMLSQAAKLLTEAGGPLSEHWLREVRRREVGMAELAAEEAWTALERSRKEAKDWNKENGARFLELARAYEREHGASSFAKSRQPALAKLKEEAEEAVVGLKIQKLFKGKVEEYLPANGAITLFYDFENPEQGQDWDGDGRLGVRQGSLNALTRGELGTASLRAIFSGELELSFEAAGSYWGEGATAKVRFKRDAAQDDWEVLSAAPGGTDNCVWLTHSQGPKISKPFALTKGKSYRYRLLLGEEVSLWFEGELLISKWEADHPWKGKHLFAPRRAVQEVVFSSKWEQGFDNVRLKGTLQAEWLAARTREFKAQALGGNARGAGEAPGIAGTTLEEVQRLFRGSVEQFDPASSQIILNYDFSKSGQREDWLPVQLHPKLPSRALEARFSGTLEFSCSEAMPPSAWPRDGFFGVACATQGEQWETVFAGVVRGEAKGPATAQLLRHTRYFDRAPCAPKEKGPRLHTLRVTDRQATQYLLEGVEVLRDSLNNAPAPPTNAVRPMLTSDEVGAVRISGTLQRAWLEEALRRLRRGKGEAAAASAGPEAEQARVQRLFKGKVESFHPDSRRIVLSYDFKEGGFEKSDLKGDWTAKEKNQNNRRHVALFQGDLEFSYREVLASSSFDPNLHGGLAVQVQEGKGLTWLEYKTGLFRDEKARKSQTQIWLSGRGLRTQEVAMTVQERPAWHELKATQAPDGPQLQYSIDAKGALRRELPAQLEALRPFLPKRDSILAVRISGTLQKAWLEEALKQAGAQP